MGTSSSDGDWSVLASRTARASMMARLGTVLAFLLPTLVAGAIVWNGALRLTKLDARLELERGRTRQVVDSLRGEIVALHPVDLPRGDDARRPADTVRVRDTMRVGDTVRIVSTDTIRVRTVDSAGVSRLREEIARLQQSAGRANEASAACARNVKVLQDSIARLNVVIKRLQVAARLPLDIRRRNQ